MLRDNKSIILIYNIYDFNPDIKLFHIIIFIFYINYLEQPAVQRLSQYTQDESDSQGSYGHLLSDTIIKDCITLLPLIFLVIARGGHRWKQQSMHNLCHREGRRRITLSL